MAHSPMVAPQPMMHGTNTVLPNAAPMVRSRWCNPVSQQYHLCSSSQRLEAFEMKGLRKILHVSWTAKKTNQWVLDKAGVKRELLDTVKARKLAYYGHTMRKQGRKK